MSTATKIAIGLGVLFGVVGVVWYMTRGRQAASATVASTETGASAGGGTGGAGAWLRTLGGIGGALADQASGTGRSDD